MINIDSDDIKKKRTLKYFIEATKEVILDKGIEKVTIRNVAKRAGYNSATIYNYFDNYKQLIFFASLDFLSKYTQAMPNYIAKGGNEIERFILMWECFCKYSFENPNIYYAVFTDKLGDHPEILVEKYFKIFPEKLGDPPERLIPMLLDPDLSRRASIASKPLIKKGHLSKEKAEEVDNMITYIYHGMLTLIINNRIDYSVDEAVKKISSHIRTIVNNAICCEN